MYSGMTGYTGRLRHTPVITICECVVTVVGWKIELRASGLLRLFTGRVGTMSHTSICNSVEQSATLRGWKSQVRILPDALITIRGRRDMQRSSKPLDVGSNPTG